MRCLACPPSQLELGGLELSCQGAWPQACQQGDLHHQGLTQCTRFLCAHWWSCNPVFLRGSPGSRWAFGYTLQPWLVPVLPPPWGQKPWCSWGERGTTAHASLPPSLISWGSSIPRPPGSGLSTEVPGLEVATLTPVQILEPSVGALDGALRGLLKCCLPAEALSGFNSIQCPSSRAC